MASKRVLLIEDSADYEQLVRAVLAACGDVFNLTSAPSLADGLEALEKSSPELVLVDLNLPDSSGYETFIRVRERAKDIPIVVLTSLDDDELAIRAVEDGAQDYLVKSLVQPKLIARCVNMALTRQNREANLHNAIVPAAPGTVLSFIGAKGGVGTTTTAVNIGAVLSQNRLKTILIELQQGRPGTLSLFLPPDPRQGLNSLLQISADAIASSDLQRCLVEPFCGFSMLCPTASPSNWRALDGAHAHAIIAAARSIAQFVILDLPSRIDEGVAEALKRSDVVTMIVDREALSVQCGVATFEQLRVASSRREVRVAVVDRSGLECPVTPEDLKAQLRVSPLAMIPAAGAALALAHEARTPLVLLDPKDAYAVAHFELAERLLSFVLSGSQQFDRSVRLLSRSVSWRPIPETTYS